MAVLRADPRAATGKPNAESAGGLAPVARKVVTGRRVGSVTEYPVPVADAALMIPVVGADGRVWTSAMNTSSLIVFDPASLTFDEVKVAPADLNVDDLRSGGVETRYVWQCADSSDLGLMGIAIDPETSAVWFTEQNVDHLGVYDPGTGTVRDYSLPSSGSAPSAVAIGNDRRVWATALGVNKVVVLDPATGAVTEFELPGEDAAPYSLAIAPDQTVWFSEFNRGSLGALNPATGAVTEYPIAGAHGTVGVAVDAAGAPWATTDEGRLVRIDRATGAVDSAAVPLEGRVYGVAVDPGGNVWVGGLSGKLAAYKPAEGTWRIVSMPTADSSPWWPAASPDGDIWSVEPGANSVVRVAAEG